MELTKFDWIIGVLVCASIFTFVFLIPYTYSEIFSLDPCAGYVTITEDVDNFYMESVCFDVTFPKNYTHEIDFYDKYNDDSFDLQMISLIERNETEFENETVFDFSDMNMTASVDGNNIVYTSQDGNVKSIYMIENGKVKLGYEIHNWTASWYPQSRLLIKTRIFREEESLSHFVNYAPIVDDIEQPLLVDEKVVGINKFYEQTVFIGSSFTLLILDPLYQVDYSPEPAQHLLIGVVSTYNNSEFDSVVNITDGMSDSNDSTTYLTYETQTIQLQEADTENLDDAFVQEDRADDAHGDDNQLKIKNETGKDRRVYIKFNTTSVEGNVTDAKLCLNLETDGDIETTHVHHVFDHSWDGQDESTLTWNNQVCGTGFDDSVDCNLTSTDNATLDTLGAWYCFDVTHAVNYESLNGSQNVSFVFLPSTIVGIEIKGEDKFASKEFETVSLRPYLNITTSTGTAITGRWNRTYDSEFLYFLRLKKTSLDLANVTVYAYSQDDEINQSQYVYDTLSGTGWFNINVTDLVEYETVTAGLGYTELRFFSEENHYFSEMFLRTETNDTEAPQFNICEVNDTTLVNNEIARFRCNITDNVDVDFAYGVIEGSEYNFTKEDDWYYYDFECFATNPSIDFTNITAVDIFGLINYTNPSLSVACDFDTTPPNVTIYFPQNITYVDLTVLLNVSANETVDTWWYNINNGTNTTFTPNTTISAKEGLNYLIVYANDTYDNIGYDDVYFSIIMLPPLIDFVPPTPDNNSRQISNTHIINVTVIDACSTVSDCLLDDQITNHTMTKSGSGSNTYCYYVINTTDGQDYNLTVWANDTLGNLNQSAQLNFRENDEPLLVSVTITPVEPTKDNNLICTVSSIDSENDSISYQYEWFENDVLISSLITTSTTNILLSGNTSNCGCEEWKCTVLPNDGLENGTSLSDALYIIPTVVLTTTNINNVANVVWNYPYRNLTYINFTEVIDEINEQHNFTIDEILTELYSVNASIWSKLLLMHTDIEEINVTTWDTNYWVRENNDILLNISIGNITVHATINWTALQEAIWNKTSNAKIEHDILSFADDDIQLVSTRSFCVDNTTRMEWLNVTRSVLGYTWVENTENPEVCDFGCFEGKCRPEPMYTWLLTIIIIIIIGSAAYVANRFIT